MKKKRGIFIPFQTIVLGLALLLLPGISFGASKTLLGLGTTQSSSSLYAYFVAVAKVINTKLPDVNVTVVETGAAVDNINRIKKGELDLGLTLMHMQFQAYHGLGPWKGKPVNDQYMLWIYEVSPLNFVVRDDSGVKSVYDLVGKPFNAGIRGSATEKTAEAILDALGVSPKYYRGGTEDAVAAIKDRRIVGYVKAAPGMYKLDASTLDIATFTPIRILGFTAEDIQKVLAKYPYLNPIVIPRGIYKETPSYQTFAALLSVMGRKNLSEDLVYRMVKAVWEGFDEQIASYPSVKGIDVPKLTLETCTVPLHPGAIKDYRELGLKVPENLIPKN
jgi:TRAP transporter TAXI family solute receptor